MATNLEPQLNFVPAEELIVDDLDTLKVLADPLRLRIRELMKKPTTVKKVAEKLDLLPTKLYYHINLLEKHGLIVLVDTRIVSGIIEKHYQIAARTVKVAKHLLSTGQDPEREGLNLTFTALLDSARAELVKSSRAGVVEWDDEGERHRGVSFLQTSLHLTDNQAAEFYEKLESLVEHYQDLSHEQQSDKDARPYESLYLVFPKDDTPNQED